MNEVEDVLPAFNGAVIPPTAAMVAEDGGISPAVPTVGEEAALLAMDAPETLTDGADFSSNAKSDVLEKYSRFHGKTEFSLWCGSPHLKYTDGFRDLLYQINPYNITCVYKRMFETCATDKLRTVDMEGVEDDERPTSTTEAQTLTAGCLQSGHVSGHVSEPSTPRQAQPEHVDKSNSCIYSSGSTISTENKRQNGKEFRGWDICERPHSAANTGYQKSTIEETRDSGRKQTKSASYRAMSPRGLPNNLRGMRHNIHHGGNLSRYVTGAGRKGSRERAGDNGSCSSSSTGSVNMNTGSCIKVGKKFKHFRRNSNYMEQYREEYTYRKLVDSRPLSVETLLCSCGNSSCPGSLTSSACIPRWYPNQSQRVQTINITSRDACENSNTGTQQRSQHQPVIKKRAAPHPSLKPSEQYKYSIPSGVMASVKFDERRQDHVLWAKEGVLKMEFFPTSLTVNNYNPMKTNSGPLKLSGSPTPQVMVSRSRPSIPSNTRGAGCPSPNTSPIPVAYGQNYKGVPITRQI